MTLYYRLAYALRRFVPERWIRAWAVQYWNDRQATIIEPAGSDLVLCAGQPVRVQYAGKGQELHSFDMHPRDTFSIKLNTVESFTFTVTPIQQETER